MRESADVESLKSAPPAEENVDALLVLRTSVVVFFIIDTVLAATPMCHHPCIYG